MRNAIMVPEENHLRGVGGQCPFFPVYKATVLAVFVFPINSLQERDSGVFF